MKFAGNVGSGLMNKRLNFSGNPSNRLDRGIPQYWDIQKVVSTDCAARRCSAEHALAGIAIATVTSLRHRLTTDRHDRCGLAEVCTSPVFLVSNVFCCVCRCTYVSERSNSSAQHSNALSAWRHLRMMLQLLTVHFVFIIYYFIVYCNSSVSAIQWN